jgi:hypothetical protein
VKALQKPSFLLVVSIVAAGLLVGCDNKPTPVTTPPVAPAGHAKYATQKERIPKTTGAPEAPAQPQK